VTQAAAARDDWAERRAAAAAEGAPRALRALLYDRVSQDSSGRARSPEEQHKANLRRAEHKGWMVVDRYSDNDISASRYGRKTRDGFIRLREAMMAGEGDVVVAWASSRITRNPNEFAEVRRLCQEHGILWDFGGRTYDLNDPDDEHDATVNNADDVRYSGRLSRDIRRAMVENAADGVPHGRTPLGYVRTYDGGRVTGMVPDPKMAPLVRDLFVRAARGDSIYSIQRDWEKAGVRTKHGTVPIGVNSLTKMLSNRAYLGERLHKGRLAKAGAWEPLTDEATFRAANARARHGSYARPGADSRAKHLATGILRCGACGLRTAYQTGRYPAYTCTATTCSLSRSVRAVDEAIDAIVVKRLLDPALAEVFTPPENNLALMRLGIEREALLAELADAEARLGNGLSVAGYAAVDAALRPQLAELEERIERMQGALAPPELLDLMGGDAAAKWAKMRAARVDLARRVLRLLFADLAIEPVGKRRRAADAPVGLRYRYFGDPADELNTWRV
jgi:site-specific DNA recombinase